MMREPKLDTIPVALIDVVNPRTRSQRSLDEITANINDVGLKRPITVRMISGSPGTRYALVCGQGRLESFIALGQDTIPALVIDASEETGHVMSLVENIARRAPRAHEMMEQVRTLQAKGYSSAEIGQKIGYSAGWVNMVLALLSNGDRRLLAAAEAGHVPLGLAVQISRASDHDAQAMLLEAFEKKELTAKGITKVRRILSAKAKGNPNATFAKGGGSRSMTPARLAEIYQRDTEEHRTIQKKAQSTKAALTLTQQIFKELFSDEEFCKVLHEENLTSVPQPLAAAARAGGHL